MGLLLHATGQHIVVAGVTPGGVARLSDRRICEKGELFLLSFLS